MSLKKKIGIGIGILSGLIVIALAILYMGISKHYMSHFYKGTTINGIDVSGMTVEEAETAIQDLIKNYELKINGRGDITDTISREDIGLVVAWDNLVGEYLAKQNGYEWILKGSDVEAHAAPIVVEYDEKKLMQVIDGLACLDEKNQIAPSDAGITEYIPEKGYEVIPAVHGSTIKKEILIEGIKKCVAEMTTTLDLEELQCYLAPEVVDETPFQTAADEINKYLSTVITYQIGENEHVIDQSVLHTWVTLNEKLEVVINEEEIDAFVNKMASSYNTCYRAKKLMTSYGQEVTIPNSYYGWKVDKAAEKEAILAEITSGETVTRELHYSMTANSHEGNDYGNSYVEINLTAQHIFLYVNGELIVESDFVSGDLATGNGTPTGVFRLTYKKKDAVLNGADYSTPVTYWMPFFGDYGMHDATWRSTFGGAIYKRDGSHGCINMPKKVAKVIFENIDKGFPVLCYELPGTESEKGIAQDQAYAVIDAIDAIGTVTLESQQAILSARGQYDTLSDMAKKYVTNYNLLVEAEKTLELLLPEEPEDTSSIPEVPESGATL